MQVSSFSTASLNQAPFSAGQRVATAGIWGLFQNSAGFFAGATFEYAAPGTGAQQEVTVWSPAYTTQAEAVQWTVTGWNADPLRAELTQYGAVQISPPTTFGSTAGLTSVVPTVPTLTPVAQPGITPVTLPGMNLPTTAGSLNTYPQPGMVQIPGSPYYAMPGTFTTLPQPGMIQVPGTAYFAYPSAPYAPAQPVMQYAQQDYQSQPTVVAPRVIYRNAPAAAPASSGPGVGTVLAAAGALAAGLFFLKHKK